METVIQTNTLSLKNFKSLLSPASRKAAAKLKVRECDETEKGHFIAYVDQGDETHDVSLTFSNNSVSNHSCDCKKGNSFCIHKIALLMQIAGGKKTSVSIREKNRSKIQEMVEDVEINDLRSWVSELLSKNKDLELMFRHSFAHNSQKLTPKDVIIQTKEAAKTIIKNKKNPDPTQMKMLVELLTTIHHPVLTHYINNPADEKAFLNFHTMLDASIGICNSIITSPARIIKYVDNQLNKTVEPINLIPDDIQWKTATNYILKYLQYEHLFREYYLDHLLHITATSSPERKRSLVAAMAEHYSGLETTDKKYTESLFDIVVECQLFEKFYRIFEPVRYHNEFNIKLIGRLMEQGHYQIAAKFCQKQINSNVKDVFNVPYLEFLKTIYTIKKDDKNLVKIISVLFPLSFHFDDFLFLMDRIPDEEEKKKFRYKMLNKSQAYAGRIKNANEFCFHLYDREKKYKKMITCISGHTSYPCIVKYFDPMFHADKQGLLVALLDIRDSWSLNSEDQKYFALFYELLMKYYKKEDLNRVIKKKSSSIYYMRPNQFTRYVMSKLSGEEVH